MYLCYSGRTSAISIETIMLLMVASSPDPGCIFCFMPLRIIPYAL